MGKIDPFPTVLDVPVSEVKQSNEKLKQILFLPSGKTYSRTALLGLLAAQEAARDAELDFASPRIGLISSTSIGRNGCKRAVLCRLSGRITEKEDYVILSPMTVEPVPK